MANLRSAAKRNTACLLFNGTVKYFIEKHNIIGPLNTGTLSTSKWVAKYHKCSWLSWLSRASDGALPWQMRVQRREQRV